MSLGPRSSVWRPALYPIRSMTPLSSSPLLWSFGLVLTVLVQNCKGKPPVATGGERMSLQPQSSVWRPALYPIRSVTPLSSSPLLRSFGLVLTVLVQGFRVTVGERVCVGYLLFVLSLVLTVLVQKCKGKPPVATGGNDEPWAPVVSVANGTLCKGKPPAATVK